MIEREVSLTKEEELFLIDTELSLSRAPCFDGLALRRLGLTPRECELVQVFFMKARALGFSGTRYSKSECLAALISCLEFLPKTNSKREMTPASCGCGDKFLAEYSKALMLSQSEKVKPLLLEILQKVFVWLGGKYPEAERQTPPRETRRTPGTPQATKRQKKLLVKLMRQACSDNPGRLEPLTRQEASRRITALLQEQNRPAEGWKAERPAMQGAWAA